MAKNIMEQVNTINNVWYGFKHDRVFKTIFLLGKNYAYLERLLSEILRYPVEVITATTREMAISSTHERVKVLDCIIKVQGKLINLELDTRFDRSIKFRDFGFFASMISNDLKRGENYKASLLKDTSYIQIILIFGKKSKKGIRRYQLCDITNHEPYFDKEKVEIIEVYVDNFSKNYYNNIVRDINEYKLLSFLDLNHEEMIEYNKKYGDEMTKKLHSEVEKLNQDMAFINEISVEEENEAIEALLLKNAEEKGKEQGMDIGRNDTQREVVKNMINLGLDIDTIVKSTGLTLEDINKIISE